MALLENLENGLGGTRPAASGLDCAAEDLGLALSWQGESKVWVQKPAAASVDFEAYQRRRVLCPLPAVIFGQGLTDKHGRTVILPGLGGDPGRGHPQYPALSLAARMGLRAKGWRGARQPRV